MLLQIPPLVLVLVPGDNNQEMTSGLLGQAQVWAVHHGLRIHATEQREEQCLW